MNVKSFVICSGCCINRVEYGIASTHPSPSAKAAAAAGRASTEQGQDFVAFTCQNSIIGEMFASSFQSCLGLHVNNHSLQNQQISDISRGQPSLSFGTSSETLNSSRKGRNRVQHI